MQGNKDTEEPTKDGEKGPKGPSATRAERRDQMPPAEAEHPTPRALIKTEGKERKKGSASSDWKKFKYSGDQYSKVPKVTWK